VTRVHRESISVRYAETDRMGVAHHSSYLLWFEIGRTGLLRDAGHAYRDLENQGVLLPVVEYGCRFMKSADYDDELVVETTVRELRSRVVAFDYRVRRGDELLAEGFTFHVCTDPRNRPRRFPDDVREAIAAFLPAPAPAR
jgi:acyl-CoA thioester hydrolase